MTEREGAPSDRLVAAELHPRSLAEESEPVGGRESDQGWPPDGDWEWGDEWPPAGGFEWNEPPYDDPAWISAATPASAHRPWYRRPGFLVGLIITALVALVVALVLLLTRASFSEPDEMRLKPTIRTSSIVLPSTTRTTPATASVTTTEAEPTRSASAEEPEPAPQPQQPVPAGPTAGGAIGEQDPATPLRPRTNVTRTPMSFTPGGR
ncbi:MAG: hypothetical protein KDB50_11830 [Mycobacterium sp.]|nr:hypothetical protein [Mycobacterium sp.]